MGRSYSYSPSPPRGYRRRGRSPSPRRYRGYSRDAPTSLLVRNLRHDCRPEDLRKPFGQFGPLKDIYLPRDYHTGEPRGFGFVQYVDPADAAEAKYQMDGQILLGRELTVVFAEENRKKPSEMRQRERVGGRGGYRSRSPRFSRSRSRSPPHRRSRTYRSRSPRRGYRSPPPKRGYHSPSPRRSYHSPSPRRSYHSRSPRRSYHSPSPRRGLSPSPPRENYSRSPSSQERNHERSHSPADQMRERERSYSRSLIGSRSRSRSEDYEANKGHRERSVSLSG